MPTPHSVAALTALRAGAVDAPDAYAEYHRLCVAHGVAVNPTAAICLYTRSPTLVVSAPSGAATASAGGAGIPTLLPLAELLAGGSAPQVTVLVLAGLRLSPLAAPLLAGLLAAPAVAGRLQGLDVSHNTLGDEGVGVLMRALRGNPVLRALDVSANRVGEAGAAAMVVALAHREGAKAAGVVGGAPGGAPTQLGSTPPGGAVGGTAGANGEGTAAPAAATAADAEADGPLVPSASTRSLGLTTAAAAEAAAEMLQESVALGDDSFLDESLDFEEGAATPAKPCRPTTSPWVTSDTLRGGRPPSPTKRTLAASAAASAAMSAAASTVGAVPAVAASLFADPQSFSCECCGSGLVDLVVENNSLGQRGVSLLSRAAGARGVTLHADGNHVLSEVLNSVTHGVGLVAALAAAVPMLSEAVAAALPLRVRAAVGVYVASLCFMLAASSLYHSLHRMARAKRVLRVLDHCAIFVLIAGTYSPFLARYLWVPEPPPLAGGADAAAAIAAAAAAESCAPGGGSAAATAMGVAATIGTACPSPAAVAAAAAATVRARAASAATLSAAASPAGDSLFSFLLASLPGGASLARRRSSSASSVAAAVSRIPGLPTTAGVHGGVLLAGIWALAVAGVAMNLGAFGSTTQATRSGFSLLMGWLVVLSGRGLLVSMPPGCLRLIFWGGVAYSAGVPFYIRGRKSPAYHVAWHMWVMLAAGLHFGAVYLYVVRGGGRVAEVVSAVAR
ncbi:hypothetical protein MMPV_000123 [Pyropia vietnamensis]